MPHRLLLVLVSCLLAGCADNGGVDDATRVDQARREVQNKAQAAEDAITNMLTATDLPPLDNNQMDALPNTIEADLNGIGQNAIAPESNDIGGNSSEPN